MLKGKLITYATIGILAYIIAGIVHEVIGHGGTCLLFGNKITLLTSVYFKSTPGNIFVDIGGPIASLIAGILSLLILKNVRNSLIVLLLVHTSMYNLFWFAGTVIHSSVSTNGDWTFAMKELNVGQSQKYILAVTGILLYVFITQILSKQLSQIIQENNLTKHDFVFPFLFASISAFLAGLFFVEDRLHSGFEGLLEMVASIPILFLQLNYVKTNYLNTINYKYIFVVGILYLLFCLTLGQGIKS